MRISDWSSDVCSSDLCAPADLYGSHGRSIFCHGDRTWDVDSTMFMPFARMNAVRIACAAVVAGMLAACATPASEEAESAEIYDGANDPFEPANRVIFSFNVMADQLVLQPAAVTYRDLFPDALKPPVGTFITKARK